MLRHFKLVTHEHVHVAVQYRASFHYFFLWIFPCQALVSRGREPSLLKLHTAQTMASDRKNQKLDTERKQVYVTRRVPQPGLDLLKEHCDLKMWDSDEAIPKEELIRNVSGVDALFCMLTDRIDEEVLEAAGNPLSLSLSVAFSLTFSLSLPLSL